jgi:tetratricopeptide (TPR) repeat protein
MSENSVHVAIAEAERLIKLGRQAEADAMLQDAVRAEPNAPALRRRLGILRAQQMDYPGARRELEAAASLAPGNASVLQPLAFVYDWMGLPVLARAAAERLLDVAPDSSAAFSLLAGMAKPGEDHTGMLEGIARAISRSETPPVDRARLGFAGGRLEHLAGNPDRAFTFYEIANRSHAATDDAAGRSKLASRLSDAFSQVAWPKFQPRAGLILLTGLPNSGQAFFADVVASHPDAALASDINTLASAVVSLKARSGSAEPFPECVAAAPPSAWQAASDAMFADLMAEHGEADVYVMSAPAAFLQAGAAAALVPGAVIVDLQRTPMAYALSGFMAHEGANAGYSYSAAGLGGLYRTVQSLTAFWEGVLPTPPIAMTDDELIHAPEAAAARVLAAAGLAMDGDCEAQIEAVPPSDRFGDNIGLDGWRAYAAHLDAFREAFWPQPTEKL